MIRIEVLPQPCNALLINADVIELGTYYFWSGSPLQEFNKRQVTYGIAIENFPAKI